MFRDPLKMEQGFAHDNTDVLLLHGSVAGILLNGSERLAVSPLVQLAYGRQIECDHGTGGVRFRPASPLKRRCPGTKTGGLRTRNGFRFAGSYCG